MDGLRSILQRRSVSFGLRGEDSMFLCDDGSAILQKTWILVERFCVYLQCCPGDMHGYRNFELGGADFLAGLYLYFSETQR